jgi:hypothetical protein
MRQVPETREDADTPQPGQARNDGMNKGFDRLRSADLEEESFTFNPCIKDLRVLEKLSVTKN